MPPSARNALAVALVVVGLGLAATVAGAAVADAPPAEDGSPNASAQVTPREPVHDADLSLPARLTLGSDATESSVVVGPDASAALDSDGTELEGRFAELTLENRIENADSEAEARSEIRDGVSRLDRAITNLQEREREAIRAYENGDISDREFLLELRAINDRARAYERSLTVLAEQSDRVSGIDVSGDLNRLRGENFLRQGQLRSELANTATAREDPQRFHVRANDAGVVLATVEDGEFRREASRIDNYDYEAEGAITISAALERLLELYPWIDSNAQFEGSIVGPDDDTYESWSTHRSGELTTFVDGRTGQVFREHQRLDLDRLDRPAGENARPSVVTAVDVTGNEYRLEINRTYRGGPAKVTVERVIRADNGTVVDTEPADLTLRVNGEAIGTTGEDGVRWIVLPYDDARVEAAAEGETLVGNVDWGD